MLLCILNLQGIQFLLRSDFTHLLDDLSLPSGIIGLHIDIQFLGLLSEDHLILGIGQLHVHGIDILLRIFIDLMHGEDHHTCIADLLPHYIGGLHLHCVVGPLHYVEDPHHQCIVGPVRHHATDHRCIFEGDLHLPMVIGLLFDIDPLLQQDMNLYHRLGEDLPFLYHPKAGRSHLFDCLLNGSLILKILQDKGIGNNIEFCCFLYMKNC